MKGKENFVRCATLLDETSNVSKVEFETVELRSINKTTGEIIELNLGTMNVKTASSAVLKKEMLQLLAKNNTSIDGCRG